MHSALYLGSLEHRRHAPRAHAFRYRLFMAYLDLDEIDVVFRGRWCWSTTRAALARFDRRHYLGDPGVPLDESVRALVTERTGRRPEGPIRLLTHLAYFGYVFNPVSFYYCFAADGRRLEAVVAEVTNTPWGERHCYVLPGSGSPDVPLEARTAKAMHVSPFHPMTLDYRWRLTTPGERLSVHMALHGETAEAGPRACFDATLALRRTAITTAALAGVLVRFPFMTARVIAAIHWQALRLWLKRVKVHDHLAKGHASTSSSLRQEPFP
jgi:DUF1365 family protein